MRSKRGLGLVLGALLALAGPFGAAVGYLSSAGALTWTRVSHEAFAVRWERDEIGTKYAFIYVSRGSTATTGSEVGAHSTGGSGSASPPTVEVSGYTRRCVTGGGCERKQFFGEVPVSSFEVDPLLREARLSGEVDGCAFDVAWVAEDEVPRREAHGWLGGSEWYESVHAGASWHREAEATIVTCLTSFDGPGDGSIGHQIVHADAWMWHA